MRATACLIAMLTTGCATVHIDPALFEAKTIALASVYARKAVLLDAVGGIAPGIYDNDYGAEVVEMELGDTEGALGDLFNAEVVPVAKAMKTKEYGRLPEATPPEDYTRVNDMTAVDIDSASAAPALGALAQALHADAAVVLRHEFSVARDTFEVNSGFTAYDRCNILVVGADGKKLWDDVVLARIPAVELGAGGIGVGVGPTLVVGNWADEARSLARRTARDAIDQLQRRYKIARSSAAKASAAKASAAQASAAKGAAS
jgi:hypothetical protein